MNVRWDGRQKKIIKNAVWLIVTVLILSASAVVFLLKTRSGFAERLYPIIDKLSIIFLPKQSEFLFFVGAFIISLMQVADKKWLLAKISIAMGCLWVVFHDSLTTWLYSLGVDSFAEAQNFDWEEAKFFFQTVQNIVKPNLTFKQFVIFGLYVVTGGVIFGMLILVRDYYGFSRKKFSYVKFALGCLFITASLHMVFKKAVTTFAESGTIFSTVASNFQNPLPAIDFHNTGLKVVVYIGESTSMMNMSLYGYPRKTTPQLDNLLAHEPHFLRFKNVFSTHTHTSQSLLEALSVEAGQANAVRPINARKRISLIDLLKNGNIPAFLYSNQGEAGTWNLASKIIFKNAEKKFSTASSLAGNADSLMDRPNDDEFFAQYFRPKMMSLPTEQSAVVLLHSYSGHGSYLANIPESFRKPVDDFVISQQERAIVGTILGVAKSVDGYDSAIKYVDFSVAKIIGQVKDYGQPTVFLYFSDHGDAAYADRGHDSSRFIHEMARVPFVMYFNSQAYERYSALFEKYKKLAETSAISSLGQLSSTVVDLLGGEVKDGAKSLSQTIGSKPVGGIQPIIIRETGKGNTYVNLNAVSPQSDDKYNEDGNDTATNMYVTTNTNMSKDTKLCYGRANTVGKALRGALVVDCLQYDMADEAIGADTGAIVGIAKAKQLAMWLNSESLDSPAKCEKLIATLNGLSNKAVLVNVPAENLEHPALISCMQELLTKGFRTAYSLPKNQLMACAVNTTDGKADADGSCKALENDLQKVIDSHLFTDFSFDYDGIRAMENSFAANKLSWNASNVNVKSYNEINPMRFRMVTFNNDDPNGLRQ